mmetsp:Transcript_10606/g.19992  ORF Transcript_10606/g.19992 Transcript_10606/m.19992 type:complete len:344 (-) Transcript_10606:229-1260(-)
MAARHSLSQIVVGSGVHIVPQPILPADRVCHPVLRRLAEAPSRRDDVRSHHAVEGGLPRDLVALHWQVLVDDFIRVRHMGHRVGESRALERSGDGRACWARVHNLRGATGRKCTADQVELGERLRRKELRHAQIRGLLGLLHDLPSHFLKDGGCGPVGKLGHEVHVHGPPNGLRRGLIPRSRHLHLPVEQVRALAAEQCCWMSHWVIEDRVRVDLHDVVGAGGKVVRIQIHHLPNVFPEAPGSASVLQNAVSRADLLSLRDVKVMDPELGHVGGQKRDYPREFLPWNDDMEVAVALHEQHSGAEHVGQDIPSESPREDKDVGGWKPSAIDRKDIAVVGIDYWP